MIAAAGAVGDAALVASEAAAARAPRARRRAHRGGAAPARPLRRLPARRSRRSPRRGPRSARRLRARARASPPGDRAAVGARTFASVYGESADRVRRGLGGLHPLLPAWTTEFAYGRVLAREALDLPTRELLGVVDPHGARPVRRRAPRAHARRRAARGVEGGRGRRDRRGPADGGRGTARGGARAARAPGAARSARARRGSAPVTCRPGLGGVLGGERCPSS